MGMTEDAVAVKNDNGKLNMYLPYNLDLEKVIMGSGLRSYEKDFLLKRSPYKPYSQLNLRKVIVFLDKIKWYEMSRPNYINDFYCLNAVKTAKDMSCSSSVFFKIKKMLIRAKIIECDNYFSDGFFPMSFRFAPKYRHQKPKLVEFNIPFKEKQIKRIQSKNQPENELQEWLHDNIKRMSFDCDKNALVDCLREDYNLSYKNTNLQTIIDQQSLFIDALISGKDLNRFIGWHFSRAGRDGRLSSTTTSLKRCLRKHLLLDGEKTVEIDQSGSQPFLLLRLYSMVNDISITPFKIFEESTKFHKLWENGFYESFSKLSGVNLEKNEVKTVIIAGLLNSRYLNSKDILSTYTSNKKAKIAVMEAFEREFPILWNQIVLLKSREGYLGASYGKKGIHTQFARYMQNFEASIFIDTICPKLKTLNIPCYTVHDCIGVRERDRETAKKVIEDTIEEVIGFKAYVK